MARCLNTHKCIRLHSRRRNAGEKVALSAMRFAIEAEKIHAELFGQAKEAVDAGKDLEADVVLLCPVCGFISLTGEEDECPICKAKKEKFIEY